MLESASRRRQLALALLLAVALVLRLAMVFVRPADVSEGDAVQYDRIALSLAAGEGYQFNGEPTALRPPGFPAMLAVVYRLFGHDYQAVGIVHALIGVLVTYLTFRIARSFFSERTAWIAAAVMAVHPASVFMTSDVLSEPLFTLVFTAGFALLVAAYAGRKPHVAALAGMLLGLATLIRPTTVVMPGMVVAGALLFRDRRPALLRAAVFSAAFVAVILPWTIRNYVVLDKVHLIATSSFGPAFWWGSYEPWDLQWRGWDAPPLDTMLHGLHPARDPDKIEEIFKEAGMRNIKENPAGFAVLAARKVWALWRPIPGELRLAYNSKVLFYGLRIAHIAFMALAITGLIACFRWQRDIWFVGLIVYWNLIHALTIAVPRYVVPLTPFLAIYAAAGALFLLRRKRRSEPSSQRLAQVTT